MSSAFIEGNSSKKKEVLKYKASEGKPNHCFHIDFYRIIQHVAEGCRDVMLLFHL